MPVHTITTDIQLQAGFLLTDERGDVCQRVDYPGQLRSLTPLHVMELYEQLHAARNQVRAQAGLPEIATPDEGVLVLAFLRLLREEPATDLRGVLQRFDEAARLVQMNRLEGETEPVEWLFCPYCSAKHCIPEDVFTREQQTAQCVSCGKRVARRHWIREATENDPHLSAEDVCKMDAAKLNGQEPAEVT